MAPALTHTFVESPVGPLLLVARGAELVRLHFVSGRRPVDVPAGSLEDDTRLRAVREQLTEESSAARAGRSTFRSHSKARHFSGGSGQRFVRSRMARR